MDPGVIRKTPRTSGERRQASRPPVVSPFPEEIQEYSGDARSNVEQQDKKEINEEVCR